MLLAVRETVGNVEYHFSFDEEEITTVDIGSDTGNHLLLQSPSVAGRHAQLLLGEDETRVVDLGSEADVFVNGERIVGPTVVEHEFELRARDLVRFVAVARAHRFFVRFGGEAT